MQIPSEPPLLFQSRAQQLLTGMESGLHALGFSDILEAAFQLPRQIRFLGRKAGQSHGSLNQSSVGGDALEFDRCRSRKGLLGLEDFAQPIPMTWGDKPEKLRLPRSWSPNPSIARAEGFAKTTSPMGSTLKKASGEF